ncbi:Asp23/Gls24 family envelope stress response protein [Christensenellaceae bacterium NSJ-44]|uniref:Asp23/Gls24 family envelope stress response protein n=1 Tax=Luoshenia tenuis TaxID=2763654 RepID=A0A926D005_9FIRM|nr:Asp23/Gls24 family envelope stress response protein [Luoshenia tenuis]MBC8528871.1 Asp23/Gls24 family envelope stress response protein [Luoshenia tenuis]SCJ21181.1 Alkaline shock protein 23 [uncultured Clostridium sp.]
MVSNENQVIPANQVDGGTISYADDVIAIIAGLAATEVSGVAGMSGGVVGGIAELLGRKNLTKGVKVEVGNEEAAIDLSIVIDFGFNLRDVSVAVQENVKKAVESMTGLRVVECNINIQGVYIEKETKEPEIVNRVK